MTVELSTERPVPTNRFIDPALMRVAIAAMHEHNRDEGHRQLFYIAVTGAAAAIHGHVTAVAGASRTYYNGAIPYHPAASAAFIGRPIKKATERQTAIDLAVAARRHAHEELALYSSHPYPIVHGIGLTAAIATDRTRKGADVVFLALANQDTSAVYVVEAVFAREAWTREQQDLMCQALALNLMLWQLRLDQVPIKETSATQGFFCREKAYVELSGKDGLEFVLAPTECGPDGEVNIDHTLLDQPFFHRDGSRFVRLPNVRMYAHDKMCFVPTSGRPLTEAHLWLGQYMQQIERRRPVYMVERQHPTKGSVPLGELAERAKEFAGRGDLLVTDGLAFYAEKARAYPGATFVIGADVAEVLLMPSDRRDGDLTTIAECDCILRVFPRWTNEGQLESLADVEQRLGMKAPAIFIPVENVTPPAISSTMVRAALGID